MTEARCVQVDVDAADADRVTGLMWATGVTAVQEIDLGGGRVRLVAGVLPGEEAGLARVLGPALRPDFFDADYDGWLDAWRPFARPVRIDALVITPPWEQVAPEQGEIVVQVDPGRSFGAGNHPTTRLMLGLMQELLQPGASVLDVGAGSGVLSVAAAVLGASHVTALDIEEEALRASRENAVRNGVEDLVVVSGQPVGEIETTFDLVLANILAPVLVALAPDLSNAVAGDGSILLSGVLSGQVSEVLAAHPGWRVVAERSEGDWRALTLRRA